MIYHSIKNNLVLGCKCVFNKNTNAYELRNVESKSIQNISNDDLFKWTSSYNIYITFS